MTDLDKATTEAVVALAYRLREWATATAAGDPEVADPDVFALEYITALRGQGWRPTAARAAPPWQRKTGPPAGDPNENEDYRASRATALAACLEAQERLNAARKPPAAA